MFRLHFLFFYTHGNVPCAADLVALPLEPVVRSFEQDEPWLGHLEGGAAQAEVNAGRQIEAPFLAAWRE